MLENNNIQNAIFHWYSGPLSLIEKIVGSKYYFSINPAMIKSKSGQEIIKRIPRNFILTESDGPFINVGNRVVKPSDVKDVLSYLSKLWNIDYLQTEKLVEQNFKNIILKLK